MDRSFSRCIQWPGLHPRRTEGTAEEETMSRILIRALATVGVVGLPALAAHAGSHTWDVNEVFSDATGQIQFIELREMNGTPGEVGVPGHSMTSNTQNYTISGPALASPTSNKFYLMGTLAFQALPGAPPVDATIPAGVLPFFFSVAGDTVTYVPWDSLTFGAVPTDGVTSLDANGLPQLNSPTNYAGQSGSVDASPSPPIPSLSGWGVAVLFGGLLAAAAWRLAFGARARA